MAIDQDDRHRKELLDAVDWNAMSRKLIGFVIRCSNEFGWYGNENMLLKGGNTPLDIVQRIIEKAYSGDRNWQPDKVGLETWLLGQVRSELSNLYSKMASQKELATSSIAEDGDEALQGQIEYTHNDPNSIFVNDSLTPEEQILYKEFIDQRWNIVYLACNDDPDLVALVEAIEFVGDKAQDLATRLNKPVSEIYSSLRRLKRRIERVSNK